MYSFPMSLVCRVLVIFIPAFVWVLVYTLVVSILLFTFVSLKKSSEAAHAPGMLEDAGDLIRWCMQVWGGKVHTCACVCVCMCGRVHGYMQISAW